ncbi:hypothetical protein [Vibrio chagasii]|uniref:hypothetical protein n=1 Tax=Vibrio chagasii TaxID=170679 RepID=UPI00148BCF88|nr:hypothetical protein [Vibrio chagasii]|tara:strand:- start:779 stop:931 length:153 start_codon:yes stop_codon:yes gene_type:complete
MYVKRIKKQKGFTIVEYIIGAAVLVLLSWAIFSGIATALISKFVMIVSGV